MGATVICDDGTWTCILPGKGKKRFFPFSVLTQHPVSSRGPSRDWVGALLTCVGSERAR